MTDLMARRLKEKTEAYERQWDGGRGSHHPDFDPLATGEGVVKASRCVLAHRRARRAAGAPLPRAGAPPGKGLQRGSGARAAALRHAAKAAARVARRSLPRPRAPPRPRPCRPRPTRPRRSHPL
jgi:hypothetical protein